MIVFTSFSAFAGDIDGDGLQDEWEKQYQLEYEDPTDADDDPDFDGLTNLEEFLLKGDPRDENSPEQCFYVAKNGSNSNLGTRKSPWLTITYALSRIRASETSRKRIIVGGGVYTENLKLGAYVTLAGYYTVPTGPDKAIRPTYTGIVGNHAGNKGSALESLFLGPADTTKPILSINDVSMRITNCVFAGPGAEDIFTPDAGVGIQILTEDAVGTTIEKSDFKGLDRGIDVEGDFPLVRQCFFEDLDEVAIKMVGGRTFGTVNLGKADDPRTGFNSFDIDSIAGGLISSNWQGTLKMENNMWNTTDFTRLNDVLSGGLTSFDFDPPGDTTTYSLIPASVFCTVTNGESDIRVENAVVLIQPAIFAPVSDNLDGVYAIPAILPGSYTVQALAPSFESQQQSINVEQSEIEAVLFELEQYSSLDTNQDNDFSLGELLRLIQFYNSGGYFCDEDTEDGYAPGPAGDHGCFPHTSDYNPQNWLISLSEILRAIQIYNSGGYTACPGEGTEDGFCV